MALIAIGKKKEKGQKEVIDWSLYPKLAQAEFGITDSAKAEIAKRLERDGLSSGFLRCGIRGGGCSGLSYHYSLEQKANDEDLVFGEDATKVCIDPKSMRLLGGTWLEYASTNKKGGFRVMNPAQKRSCSCGQSFAL